MTLEQSPPVEEQQKARVPPSTHSDQRGTTTPLVARALQQYAAVIVLVALAVFFSILLPDRFGQLSTARTMLSTEAVLAVLAIGVIFPLVAGEFDISIGAVFGFCALVVARLDGPEQWPALAAVGVALLVGLTIGLFNGLLVTKVRMSSFIATLGTSVVVAGFAQWISGGKPIFDGVSTDLTEWGRRVLFDQIPIVTFYLVAVAIVAWFLLEVTVFGRYLRAVGSNVKGARLAGLPIDRLKLTAFALSGLLAALAGVISTMKLGSAHPSAGPPLLLPAYAAAFLGATTIRRGRFNVAGTVVAVFLIAVGITGIQLWGAPSWVDPVFNGSALIVAVALSSAGRRTITSA